MGVLSNSRKITGRDFKIWLEKSAFFGILKESV